MVEYLLEVQTHTKKPFFAYESMGGDRLVVSYQDKKKMLVILYSIRKEIRRVQPKTWGELKSICYKICIENGISQTISEDS